MATTQYTAAQKAALFATATRQNLHTLPSQTVTSDACTMQFTIPKVRLLQRLLLHVKASVKITHASGTAPTTDNFTHARLLRRISVDHNNSFIPFQISGVQSAMYGLTRFANNIYAPQSSNAQGFTYVPNLVASADGTNNSVEYCIDLPMTVNDRDPVGLILLQNETSTVTLTIDIATANEMLKNAAGYTVAINSLTITPFMETYSIPAQSEAFPDISVLKLVSGRRETFIQNANEFQLVTGQMYRKLILYFEDSNGAAIADTDLEKIELKFNMADTNYSITGKELRLWNQMHYYNDLPKGMYVFDFGSYPGMTNLAGTKDIIDTEKLTNFVLWFNAPNSGGTVDIVSERLDRIGTAS